MEGWPRDNLGKFISSSRSCSPPDTVTVSLSVSLSVPLSLTLTHQQLIYPSIDLKRLASAVQEHSAVHCRGDQTVRRQSQWLHLHYSCSDTRADSDSRAEVTERSRSGYRGPRGPGFESCWQNFSSELLPIPFTPLCQCFPTLKVVGTFCRPPLCPCHWK